MNNELNSVNIDAILADQEVAQGVSRMTKIGRLFAGVTAIATIGVGASAMIDGEPPVKPAVAANECVPELGDVCDGQTIVYEDPFDSTVDTNVSGVTFPDKGTTTTPAPTTTEVAPTTTHVVTTVPRTTTPTTVAPTTTFRPAPTTTERPNHTTTTINKPADSTTTTVKPVESTTSTTSTIPGEESEIVPTAD